MTPLIASAESSGPRELPDADIHHAICAFVFDLGLYPDEHWGKVKHRILIAWELEQKMADGRPFMLSREYTLSLHEKSLLYAHLKGWKGTDLTAEELKGFDVEQRIGKQCRLTVVHTLARNGKTYANIEAIAPPGKSAPKMEVANKEPPKWFEAKRAEYAAAMAKWNAHPDEAGDAPPKGGGFDEIPFMRLDP